MARPARSLLLGDLVFFSPAGRVEVTRAHPHHCVGEVVRLERVDRHTEAIVRFEACDRCGAANEYRYGRESGGVVTTLVRYGEDLPDGRMREFDFDAMRERWTIHSVAAEVGVTACGIPDADFTVATFMEGDPELVTCEGCLKAI